MKQRYVYLSAILSALYIFSFCLSANASENSKKPNILIIMADDLGYGDLSCMGGTDIQTPNIDNLFSRGMRFTNFYANSTVCSPSRASLMSGCYPDKIGVPGVIRTHETDSWGYLLPSVITLPQVMKPANYKTVMIGKWHLGLESPNLPNDRGFDFFKGFLGDMMDDYQTHLRHGNNYMRLNNQAITPEGHATDLFSEWSVDYITNEQKSEEPFFLYLAYNAPHFPIQPPVEYLEKVKKREKNSSENRVKNVALVEHLDDGIGRVIKALEKSDQIKNTIIIFTSDNGGHLPSGASNGNLHGGKQDMYEGGIKVPACIVWKDMIKPGTETGNLALTMDLYPTLCDIAGVGIYHPIDGISLRPTLEGRPQVTDNRVVYWMRREGGSYGGLCYYAARLGQYKLLQNTPFEPFQLFNLDTDPKEYIPLDQNSQYYKDLLYRLSQHIRETGNIPWQK